MSDVRATIDIDASPGRVWEVVMDPEQLGDWVTIHRKLGKHSDGDPREGFQMQQVLCLRGARFKVRWTLVECEAQRRAVWEGRGPARSRARTEYRLSGRDGHTQFDYRNEFNPPLGPLGAMASRAIVGGIPAREARKTLEQLKRLVEGGG